jgi:Uma2 family endonuclease
MTLSYQTDIDLVLPDSDGKPMADNTEQFRWIVLIKENLEIQFANDPNVFVAGDLFWYPIKSRIVPPAAPDAMVVFGRPKGKRSSYRQWNEDNIAPQVVFEIRSPCNTEADMDSKLEFYDTYGVEEYYFYDPDTNLLKGWQRVENNQLQPIAQIDQWISPRLGIRVDLSEQELVFYRSDGQRFLSSIELEQRAKAAEQQLEQVEQQLGQAEQELEQERQSRQALLAKLRNLGINPEQL